MCIKIEREWRPLIPFLLQEKGGDRKSWLVSDDLRLMMLRSKRPMLIAQPRCHLVLTCFIYVVLDPLGRARVMGRWLSSSLADVSKMIWSSPLLLSTWRNRGSRILLADAWSCFAFHSCCATHLIQWLVIFSAYGLHKHSSTETRSFIYLWRTIHAQHVTAGLAFGIKDNIRETLIFTQTSKQIKVMIGLT